MKCDELSDELFELIKPYYKSAKKHNFRQRLSPHESKDLLLGIENIVIRLEQEKVS